MTTLSPFSIFRILLEDFEGDIVLFSEPIWLVVEKSTIPYSDIETLDLRDWSYVGTPPTIDYDYINALAEEYVLNGQEYLLTLHNSHPSSFIDLIEEETS